VVCSACGFDNPGGMNFCGMCGTPLPHRPLTAPGAQSTLHLTRVPVEGGIPHDGQVSSTSAGVLETPIDAASATGEPQNTEPAAANEPPPVELVPDVPLDEYIQNFRYHPPSDPSEVTMRGDAHVAAPGAVVEQTAAQSSEPPPVTASTASPEAVAPIAEQSSHDVASRLGLDPQAPSEEAVERTRFLDLHPADESKPAGPGTSTIVGPSFLGLSDAPQLASEADLSEPEQASRRGWRMWLAAAVIVLFVGLGLMEWRSQMAQTNNGPVAVLRARLRNWRHNAQPPASNQAAPAATGATSTGSQPEMQVQEQAKPPQNSNAPAPPPTAANPAPAATLPAPTAATSTAKPAADKPMTASDSPAPEKSVTVPKPLSASSSAGNNPPASAAEKPKPERQPAEAANADAAAKSGVPGAEELDKARNASDSVAAAAWLWKATAKGNPYAPVLLADMYIKGDGVPRSCEQAVVLLKTAAEKENARARNRLASMYATGNCVPRNRVEAYRWLSSALTANPNSDWARQNRDLIWQQMTSEERAAAGKYR